MSFPRYPAYKPSGVEWLGEVPEHWKLVPIKRILQSIEQGWSPQCEAAPAEPGEWGVLKVGCVNGGKFNPDENKALPRELLPDERLGIRGGDVLVSRANTRELVGSVAMAERDYPNILLCDKLYRLRTDQPSCSPAFLARYLASDGARNVIETSASGASSSMLNIGQSVIINMPIALPSASEQADLIHFLDRETAKIDALIAEQQRLIELLKEKRQAVISHAVTKGLNPDAPMKDSGVEWLGEVPEHWELLRGRLLFGKREAAVRESDEVVTAFRDGQVIQRSLRRADGFTLAELEVGYQHVFAGDLVIHGMDAFAGAIGVSESDGKCTPEYSVCYPIKNGISNNYFAHALRIMAKRDYIFVICPSVRERAPRFRFSTFKDVVLPVPPLEEQLHIEKTLEHECSAISSLLEAAEMLIALLQERRSALISAAVTGQIDVRGLVSEASAA